MYNGAIPSITLGELLEQGYLQETDNDHSNFNMNDKAILVLSLSQCLIHLWHGPWLKEPWKAEAIQFLNDPSKIIDIHRPYFTCSLNKGLRDGSPQLNIRDIQLSDLQPTLLAFARLLLEIEVGQRVLPKGGSSVEELEIAISRVLKERMNRYGRGDYNQAIRGCFHVNALLKRQARERHDNASDRLHIMRKAFYEAVVEPLERNFSMVQDQNQSLKLRSLSLKKNSEGSYQRDSQKYVINDRHLEDKDASNTEATLREYCGPHCPPKETILFDSTSSTESPLYVASYST